MKKNLTDLIVILTMAAVFSVGVFSQKSAFTFEGKLTDGTSTQPTAFTYQGQLTDGGVPANGTYDFQFTLYDAANMNLGSAGGSLLVTSGIFTASVDGAAALFTSGNPPRSLEIGVKLSGGGPYTTLTPRQPITSSPFSLKALSAASADSFTGVLGVSQGGTGIGPGFPLANTFLRSNGAGWQVSAIQASDVPVGSTNYVQNGTTTQAATDFNVGGTGTATIFNALTQYNIGNSRVLSVLGSSNTFAGINAGTSNSIGVDNTFIGNSVASVNTAGSQNTFVGAFAGNFNSMGSFNSFFGRDAGDGNTDGVSNSFFGYLAGWTNTTGSNNTIIGSQANVGANNLSNATAIGAGSLVSTSFSVVLGSGSDTVRIPGRLKVQNPDGLIVTSPNGACWIITVSNAGAMSTTSVTCP